MSEGINFSDGLARCVVMIGLPFPNAKDPELIEKMAYLDAHFGRSQPDSQSNTQRPCLQADFSTSPGKAYYQNLCMRAVNQSIGRSIRHIKDYACVVLIDARYSSPRIFNHLPQWILRCLRHPQSFGEVVSTIATFFKSKTK